MSADYIPKRTVEHRERVSEERDTKALGALRRGGAAPSECRKRDPKNQRDGHYWCHTCWRAYPKSHKCESARFEPHVRVRRKKLTNGRSVWSFEK